MIKTVKLTNFFGFKEEVVNLHKRTNLLVGINGSGKSNLLKAIQLLKVGVEGNANDTALKYLIISKWGGFDNIYCKSRGDSNFKNSIGLEFIFDGDILSEYGPYEFRGDVTYKIILLRKGSTDNYSISESIALDSGFQFLNFINGSGRVQERLGDGEVRPVQYDDYDSQELVLSKISDFDRDRYLPLVLVKNAIKDIAVYNYFDTTAESKIRKAMIATSSERKLLPDGSNLPQILNLIKIKHKDSFRKIQAKLHDVNEMFSGFDFNFLGSGVFELMLDEKELNSSVHITHISDGTLRYLCLLSILYNPNRGKFVCIDEPEVGLHPDMIYNIASAIEEAGLDTTFIIATHSENVLNAFNIENIRVFEKDENNCTIVQEFSEEDFSGWYDEFSPGNMWRAGDLGGKRW